MARRPEDKVVNRDSLRTQAQLLHQSSKTIVTTNGCFDFLHFGHLNYLSQAKALGDVLICGVNSDQSVRSLNKGTDRPVFSEDVRAYQLASLEAVDWVYIFSEDTPLEFIKLVTPALHVKGGDYDPENMPETELVRSLGGEVKILPLVEGYSTTNILSRLRNST